MRTLKQPDKETEGVLKDLAQLNSKTDLSLHPDTLSLTSLDKVPLDGFGFYADTDPEGVDDVGPQLRDDKSPLGRLSDIPLHDLPEEPNIDILLNGDSDISLGSEDDDRLDIFTGGSGQDLSELSPETPQPRGRTSAANDSSDSFNFAKSQSDTVDSSSEKSDGRVEPRKQSPPPTPSGSRPPTSPNRQGPQRCPICQKIFGNASALAKHKLTHSDERRYVCSVCAKAFKRQDHLNGHMLTHRNKKPYECLAEGCGKSYCDARSLRRHTENHHHHTGSTSSNTTPEPSPPTCIQYAPPPPVVPPVVPPKEQPKVRNSQETSEREVVKKILPKPAPKKAVTSKQTTLCSTVVPSSNTKSRSTQVLIRKNQPTSIRSKIYKEVVKKYLPKPAPKKNETSKNPTKTSTLVPSSNTKSRTAQKAPPVSSNDAGTSDAQVECNLCHRKFKNTPALNGHMRLHGGYFKKDGDPKRYDRRDNGTPPLQTASSSVRALIGEKIILKRITKPSGRSAKRDEAGPSTIIKKEPEEQKTADDHPVTKKPKGSVKRAISDPGAHPKPGGSRSYSMEEYGGPGILASSLLEGVDSRALEASIKAAELELSIPDYQTPGPSRSYRHRKDVRSVLDSPLPANLAEFAYENSAQAEPQITTHDYASTSLTGSITYSTAPMSQGAQVLVSSSASYYSAASNTAASTSTCTFQSQMMPNSADPLLSSSPKEYPPPKKALTKVVASGCSNDPRTSSQQGGGGLAGIMLDTNGELKLIHSDSPLASKALPINITNLSLDGPPKAFKTLSIPCNATYTKGGEKLNAVLNRLDGIKDSPDRSSPPRVHRPPETATPATTAPERALNAGRFRSGTSNAGSARKKPKMETNPRKNKSRLRHVKKSYGSGRTSHYTPPPILNTSRQSQGLYWQAVAPFPSSTTLSQGSSWDENLDIPGSDSVPHINLGPEYQAEIPECMEPPGNERSREFLIWDSKFKASDLEVERYLEFACCAAVPGGGRNKEHALHLLQICHGRIQEAMVQLMQPTAWLPSGHPLLTFDYADCEKWNITEMETFYQSLLKYDKDFTAVSKEIGTKTIKQCIQFYYIWKKVCPEDYKKLRIVRKKFRESEWDSGSTKSESQGGDTDLVSTTSSECRLFVCEYNDCSASFNSRAALNGHIRIHVGGTGSGSDKKSSLQVTDALEEFPCKLCGKVFSKVKSRSAHMKSHRPSESDSKKNKVDQSKSEPEQSSSKTSNS